jgi:hypothetical protein
MKDLIPVERIENKIYMIRKQKVMLDFDLAELYGVSTRLLKQAVRRNRERFPEDFMFPLSQQEISGLPQFTTSSSRSQIVILKRGQNIKYAPFAFTENGVAMLSSVLRSKYAIEVNIQIMRAFTNLRRILSSHIEVSRKLKELEGRMDRNDTEIHAIFETIRKMITPAPNPKNKIGFIKDE